MTRLIHFISPVFVILLAALSGCGGDGGDAGNGPAPVVPTRLVAELHQDPGFSSVASDVWDSLAPESVQVGTDNNYNANALYRTDLFAEMKALHTDTLLYIWVRWNDADQDNRFGSFLGSWVDNTVRWSVSYPDDTIARNEDRFYLLLDRGGPGGADCAGFCHTSASVAGRYFYGSATDNADVWQWKAHRTGLARRAEDMHVTDTMISPDPQVHPVDDNLYFRNWSAGTSRPLYMHHDTTAYTGAGLLQTETPSGSFRAFENYDDWMIFSADAPPQPRPVPGYYIYDSTSADGSRWDVRAISQYDSGYWTVVFRRALSTADASSDVDFGTRVGDSLLISVAIANNSGIQHYGRAAFYLVFP